MIQIPIPAIEVIKEDLVVDTGLMKLQVFSSAENLTTPDLKEFASESNHITQKEMLCLNGAIDWNKVKVRVDGVEIYQSILSGVTDITVAVTKLIEHFQRIHNSVCDFEFSNNIDLLTNSTVPLQIKASTGPQNGKIIVIDSKVEVEAPKYFKGMGISPKIPDYLHAPTTKTILDHDLSLEDTYDITKDILDAYIGQDDVGLGAFMKLYFRKRLGDEEQVNEWVYNVYFSSRKHVNTVDLNSMRTAVTGFWKKLDGIIGIDNKII